MYNKHQRAQIAAILTLACKILRRLKKSSVHSDQDQKIVRVIRILLVLLKKSVIPDVYLKKIRILLERLIPRDEDSIPSDNRLKWTKPGEQKRPDFRVEKDITLTNSPLVIKAGTLITNVTVMAFGTKIRYVGDLVDKYKIPAKAVTKIENGKYVNVPGWKSTDPADWKKVKGTTYATDGTYSQRIEVHWYQCDSVGKVEYKRKEIDDA
jgi:hypothetical protein